MNNMPIQKLNLTLNFHYTLFLLILSGLRLFFSFFFFSLVNAQYMEMNAQYLELTSPQH